MTETKTVLVCGFLGAGKTALAQKLTSMNVEAIELNGLTSPNSQTHGPEAHVITLVDCANLPRQWDDPLIGPLLRRQLEAADALVLSLSDLTDASPAQALLGEEAAPRTFDRDEIAEALAALRESPKRQSLAPIGQDDLRESFESWSYRGPARFRPEDAERLGETRPSGVVRLVGTVLLGGGGLELQVTGRVRQSAAAPTPKETSLDAIWPKGALQRSAVDMWFAQAVADSGHSLGMFGYR